MLTLSATAIDALLLERQEEVERAVRVATLRESRRSRQTRAPRATKRRQGTRTIFPKVWRSSSSRKAWRTSVRG
jgi:hypothetical protein